MNKENPDWIRPLLPQSESFPSPKAVMECVHELAYQNVIHNGGPFSAIIVDQNLKLISAGTNVVVLNHDSTCHAEIMAIRAAQSRFNCHDLSGYQFSLYANCSPCIMCFGVLWWSGIKNVIYSLSKDDAESLGFAEGPVTDNLWQKAQVEKGISVTGSFERTDQAFRAFRKFKENGILY